MTVHTETQQKLQTQRADVTKTWGQATRAYSGPCIATREAAGVGLDYAAGRMLADSSPNPLVNHM